MAKVYWAFMKERHGAATEAAFDAYSNVLEYTARLRDFHRLRMRTLPVAHARNAACQAFWNVERYPQSDDDTLVMLDADHVMQPDIVERLAAHKVGVVGALAVSRGETPFICFFGKGPDGNLYNLSEWQDGELAQGVVVGSGAIAIKRWVLKKLEHCKPSWFRYLYGGFAFESTEEMFFGYECNRAGIPHYCDTSIWIPHCSVDLATPDDWRKWFKEHPNVRAQVQIPTDFSNMTEPPHFDPKELMAKPNGNGHESAGEPEKAGGDKWENIVRTMKLTS